MCSRGTHSCGHMQKVRVQLERADVVIWNTPRTQNHSLKARVRASADLLPGAGSSACARSNTFLSLEHTCVPAEYTANKSVHPGSRARHPGWRQPGTNEGRQKETNESVHSQSRARHPGCCPPGEPRQTQAGRQRETHEPVQPESRARHPPAGGK